MLKTLLATTAIATMMTWSVQAQTAPAAEDQNASPPMIENHMDGDTTPADEGVAPAADESTDSQMAPAEPDTADSQMAPAEPDTADSQMAPAEPDTADSQMAPATPETADTEMAPAATDMAQQPAAPEGWSAVDMATISADTLIGTDIRTYDQDDIASVEDVLMTPDGQVESVVARFGGFLGFGENTVLLSMDEISVVKDADGNVAVLTNLTPDALKDRPEYKADDAQG